MSDAKPRLRLHFRDHRWWVSLADTGKRTVKHFDPGAACRAAARNHFLVLTAHDQPAYGQPAKVTR